MFISNAYAQSLSGFSMNDISGFIPIILMFILVYVLMVRPQQKRQKEQKDMIEALALDDEVVTVGGLLGKVTKIAENHVSLQIASGADVLVQKTAIVAQLPKGTLSSL